MPKTYALFDVDGTLFPGDSLPRFLWFAYRQGLCSRSHLSHCLWAGLLYMLGMRTAEQSKELALSFLAGHSQSELYSLSLTFVEKKLLPRLRPQAGKALETHRKNGDTLLFITASPSFYLEPFKDAYGVTDIIGTRVDIDPTGMATGRLSSDNCRGIQKPLRLAEYLAATGDQLDYDTSYAYGDSPGDVPMLETCAHKVAVNARCKLKQRLRALEGVSFVRWRGKGEGNHGH